MSRLHLSHCVAVLAAILPVSSAWSAPMFMGLGDLGPVTGGMRYSHAYAVSADGSVVVGDSNTDLGRQAFRWTLAQGMLGFGGYNSAALGVSADGSVIAGHSGFAPSEVAEPFRWTASTGIIQLSAGTGGRARGVSDDGSTVVGFEELSGGVREAILWPLTGEPVRLGDLPGGNFSSEAYATSADGSVVVGQAWGDSGSDAMRWTAETGIVGLGCSRLVPVIVFCNALDVSADGSVVVGWGGDGAFRWTAATGLVIIADGSAQAVSADGSVVAGYTAAGGAFIWDETTGMLELDVVLIELGLDLTGWTLTGAFDVSPDGLTIVGHGINPNGNQEGWIAFIPEPGTGLLVMAGLLALAVGRRRRRL